MGWKPQVKTGSDPKWYQNGLTFATQKEAEKNAFDLMMRWFAVTDHGAVEVAEEATHTYVDGVLGYVEVKA
jgi:hypothetical protein